MFINPFTLLIIPLLGSLLILIYPSSYNLGAIKSFSTAYGLSKSSSSPTSSPEIAPIRENTNQNLYWNRLHNVENSLNNKSNSHIKTIALITSFINLFISLIMWLNFDSNYAGYQFITELSAKEHLSFLHLTLGVDGISLYFVLLTTFITPIALLSSHNEIEKNLKFYLVCILLLETLQIAVFVALDLLIFYIFFESVLIPLFLIIGVWGAGEARIRAAYLLFLYTLFGSLFMLLAILQIYNLLGSTDYNLLSMTEISLESQKILWLNLSFSKNVLTSNSIKNFSKFRQTPIDLQNNSANHKKSLVKFG